MSAQLNTLTSFRRMEATDLDAIEAIERTVFTHPWTRGNFADSLAAGYHCHVLECDRQIAGYCVMMIAAGEAHLLNLSIAAPLQRGGLGSELLRYCIKLAQSCGAQSMYLEVRASNGVGRSMYLRNGFSEIGIRRAYYPATVGRENAVTMEKKL